MPASVLAAGFTSTAAANNFNYGGQSSTSGFSSNSLDTTAYFPTSFGLIMKK